MNNTKKHNKSEDIKKTGSPNMPPAVDWAAENAEDAAFIAQFNEYMDSQGELESDDVD